MTRDRYAQQSLGTLHQRIKQAKVLLVGAGGIGCELLKNLVLTGFGQVDVVDLDTIDLSNLNRQFLFRHEHIKKSKAMVSKASASRFNPNVALEAHHANIMDKRFNVAWFAQFRLVFNALDNLQARRHVNRMCLMADVPLIESGTTGFNGQVQVIKRGRTECYDCNAKETPKTFPVCTIRSTPSQPIHCIVWAKSYLFQEIFGVSEEGDAAADMDHSEDSENAEEIRKLNEEAEALKKIRDSMASEDFAEKIFQKVFHDDIKRLLGMEDMWKTRKPPKVLEYDKISTPAGDSTSTASQDQSNWSLEENLAVFKDSIRRLSARAQKTKTGGTNGSAPTTSTLSFDKDDDDTLDFVAAAANLRSIVFGIESRSKFDIKQMAGNIIPAIATTNAIVAGLCVLQAFKIMKDDYDNARMVFLTKSADRMLSADKLQPPNPDCPVCGVAQLSMEVDLSRITLQDLVVDFLRSELGYGEEFSVSNDAGIMYDPDLEDNLPKKLSELGVQADGFLTVVDEADEEPRVNLVIAVTDKSLSSDSKPFKAAEAIKIPTKPRKAPAASSDEPQTGSNGHANGSSSTPLVVGGGTKRKASIAELDDVHSSKKGKSSAPAPAEPSDEPVVVDDETEIGANVGAIVIDD